MKRVKKILTFLLIISLFGACTKDDELSKENDSKLSASDVQKALAEYIIVSEQFKSADESAEESQLSAQGKVNGSVKMARTASDSIVFTIDPFDLVTFPKTITANFGTSGILGKDNVLRKGKIISTINQWTREPGFVRNTTLDNYYHNNCQIMGHIRASIQDNNADNNLVIDVVVNNGKYIRNIGDTILFTRNSTLTQLLGSQTPLNIWDDEYSIDFVEHCVTSENVKLIITAVEPLIYSTLTKAKGGVLSVVIENFVLPIIIDFDKQEVRIGDNIFPFE